jgi:hypothetical protein
MQRHLIVLLPLLSCALACAEPAANGDPAKADHAPTQPTHPSASLQGTAIPKTEGPTAPRATDATIGREPPRIVGDSKGGKGQLTAD